jgi:hypothetical protein
MTDDNNTAINAIEIDEDILPYSVFDEALEVAATDLSVSSDDAP